MYTTRKLCLIVGELTSSPMEGTLKMFELEKQLWLTQAQILQCKYLEIKEQQRRILEKWFMTKFFLIFLAKRTFFSQKWLHLQNKL